MKKLWFVLTFAFLVNLTYGQGDLDNQFYFRFGYSNPSWKYLGADDKDDWPDDAKKWGGVFELGSIFMLNGIKLADGMRIGINVDYMSLQLHQFKINDGDSKFTTFCFGSKIGPSFTYSPVDKLEFDAVIKFNPVWVASAFMKDYSDEDPEVFVGVFGTKMSVGFNIRYSILMMGFEYNPGGAKMKWTDEDAENDDYLGNPADMDDDGDKTSMPGYNITLGLSF